MDSCEAKRGTCENVPGRAAEGQCPCGCGDDPIQCAMNAWAEAFHQAKKAAMADILKAKIQKAWGAKMDKIADAVIAAMEIKKESIMAIGKAKCDFRTKLQDILTKE